MQVSALLLPELGYYQVTSHRSFIPKRERKDYFLM